MSAAEEPFRPYTPPRRNRAAGVLEFLWIAWREPLGIWSERHFNEPILYGESLLGKAMSIQDPVWIRHVLVDNAANYHKGPVQRRILGPLLAEGLLLLEEDAWRRVRRILAPLFAPRNVTALAGKMQAIVQARIARWPDDGTVNLDQEMTRLTFDILSSTMFSDALGGKAEAFEKALNEFIDVGARIDPLDMIGAPDWVPRLGKLRGRNSSAFFEKRVGELVAARKALIASGEPPPPDLLTALIRTQDPETGQGLTDREVASNILTFILAGHETTARTLAWCMHLLSRSRRHWERVRAEAPLLDLDQPDWDDRLPWTRAVIEEALRLFPPAPLMSREAIQDDVIDGRRIAKGTGVLIAPWVVQRHRLLWEDADAFKPERFMPGEREKIDRFAYLPFSGGPRNCIGASFAMQEAMIALSTIAGAVDIEAVMTAEPTPEHRITLRPREDLKVRVLRRSPPP